MAARLSDSWLDELRSRVGIVDVVSDYVSLKQSGRRYWGLCPFHGEKTASFSVDPEAQMFYCFGCHKGGNVIHFLMELERMEFLDAVKLLAERAHMQLPESGDPAFSSASREKKQKIYEVNLAAAKYFHAQIWLPGGAQALEYLHGRGLDDRDIRKFGLGCAQSGWDSLITALSNEGFDRELLVLAGLAVSKNDKYFDMFRGRVIFPIIDAQGRVLGFGGRAMGDATPKYLNTPDTPVFNKRNGLYAMNFVKRERPLKRLVLVEGYMDVVSMRKYGVTGVVATLGTALTTQQTNLLKRNADEVWLAYDGDSAGQKAILRGLDLCDEASLKCRVIVFPDGKDPDDFIKEQGLEGFNRLETQDPVMYRLDMAAVGLDLKLDEGRAQYAIACCEILKKVRSPVELDMYVERLTIKTGFNRDVLLSQIGTVTKQPPATQTRSGAYVKKEHFSDCETAERTLLSLLASKLIDAEVISESDFDDELYIGLAAKLISGKSPASVLDEYDDEKRERVAGILTSQILPDRAKALGIAEDCLSVIRRTRTEREITDLKERLKNADADERIFILKRINELNKG